MTDHTPDAPRPIHADADHCLAGLLEAFYAGRRCLVVTAEAGSGLSSLLATVAATTNCPNFARLDDPELDPRGTLESLLKQFGFEPFGADVEDLRKLACMYLAHESRRGRPALIIVEQVDRQDPETLECLQALIELVSADRLSTCILLSGRPALLDILESAAMARTAGLTGLRWQLKTAGPKSGQTPPMLLVSRNGELLRHAAVGQAQLLIGRQPHNDLVLDSPYVSRHHALLVPRADGSLLIDLNSTNGTYVNLVAIRQHRLCHGDVVCIGDFRLKYLQSAGAQTAVTKLADPGGRTPAVDSIEPARIGNAELHPVSVGGTAR